MKTAIIVLLTLFAVFVGIGYYVADSTVEVITITVKEKERITDGDSSKYLIFTEEETFENIDTIFFWKWNSSDLYGSLDPGETYQVRVYGYRMPTMSMYRNIVEIVE